MTSIGLTTLALMVAAQAVGSQTVDRRDYAATWLRGDFSDADKQFEREKRRVTGPLGRIGSLAPILIFQSEFETERGNYRLAFALLNDARKMADPDLDLEMINRRTSKLFSVIGEFSAAQEQALGKTKWDRTKETRIPNKFPMSLNSIAESLQASGQYTQAIRVFERAAADAKYRWRMKAPDWIRAKIGLATSRLAIGATDKAASDVEDALQAARSEWGTTSIPAMDSLDLLGCIRLVQGRLTDARTALDTSRQRREALYGQVHLKIGDSQIHNALLLSAGGAHDHAAEAARSGLAIYHSILGRTNPKSALVEAVVAGILAKSGQTENARRSYATCIATLERSFGITAPIVESIRRDQLRLLVSEQE